jgi:DNA-binding IclR family transcriptional regulator
LSASSNAWPKRVLIEQNPETDKYRLGIKTFEVGSRYLRARMGNIGAVARPQMQELVDTYHVSANLAFRDGLEIVYVEAVEPNGVPLRVAYSVGDRFGIHHTALGKALVAWLPLKEQQKLLQQVQLKKLTPTTIATPDELEEELRQVRERGYAVDDEESMPGLRCVGAPIWGANGVAAALSASGTTLQILPESVDEVAHSVMEAAAAISAQLGGTPRLEL